MKILFLIFNLLLCKEKLDPEEKNSLITNLFLLNARKDRVTLSGTAVKGIIKNAEVKIHSINSDGSCNSNSILGVTNTDSNGEYTILYNKSNGLICLQVTPHQNGLSTMYDEKTKQDIPILPSSNFKMNSLIQESKIRGNSKSGNFITPFSRMVSRRFQFLIKNAGSNPDLPSLNRRASRELVIRFGLGSGLSSNTKNKNSVDNTPELDDILVELNKPNSPLTTKFISILVGFSQLSNRFKKVQFYQWKILIV